MAEGSHNSADDDGSDCLSKNICTAKNATNPLDHDVTKEFRSVPGNNVCADCNSPEPDWASLNLGILNYPPGPPQGHRSIPRDRYIHQLSFYVRSDD